MAFAAYSAPFIRESPRGTKKQQLLWGDFVSRLGGEDGDWVEVRGRGETGWMRRDEVQEEQLLEINFVDVGQGDGAFVVVPPDDDHPRDRFLLVDAGEEDNMFRFLRWRFNLSGNPDRVIRFDHAVITHPDSDHYRGFSHLFRSEQFEFGTVCHNGLVERKGSRLLGEELTAGGHRYQAELFPDRASLDRILGDPALVGSKWYPNLLKDCTGSGRADDVRGVCAADGFLPGYEEGRDLSVRVLAPVPEEVDGRPMLRRLGDDGVTKNGHSVVLKLRYRDVSILLGGDLNVPAEEYLLAHYTGTDPDDLHTEEEESALVAAARATFGADVAKACHHGSADFTDLFLRAIEPLAFVISSGDAESHAHPRPDALGAFGKAGRGPRPLLFSTELARSAPDTIRQPFQLRQEIEDLYSLREAAPTPEERARIQQRIQAVLARLERSVAVYGMITLRTDGDRVLLAQKLESPRSATHEEFDVHLLEREAGELVYRSKH
jgi:beta-lactamase superfamily II metal-dependent hydrolase